VLLEELSSSSGSESDKEQVSCGVGFFGVELAHDETSDLMHISNSCWLRGVARGCVSSS
jgi:hypothetical protein